MESYDHMIPDTSIMKVKVTDDCDLDLIHVGDKFLVMTINKKTRVITLSRKGPKGEEL